MEDFLVALTTEQKKKNPTWVSSLEHKGEEAGLEKEINPVEVQGESVPLSIALRVNKNQQDTEWRRKSGIIGSVKVTDRIQEWGEGECMQLYKHAFSWVSGGGCKVNRS